MANLLKININRMKKISAKDFLEHEINYFMESERQLNALEDYLRGTNKINGNERVTRFMLLDDYSLEIRVQEVGKEGRDIILDDSIPLNEILTNKHK